MKLLFVCHGNICRSTMAEYIMKDLVKKQGLQDYISVSSAGTSAEETGNDIYPPAKRMLKDNGIEFDRHYARRIEAKDYEDNDLIIGMDFMNIANLNRAFNNDPDNKIIMLLKKNIEDPWYTDDFQTAYDDIYYGCCRLLEDIIKKEKLK